MKQYMVKVPGGKLLRIKITVEKNQISSLQILGDFFVHPEETLFALEKSLLGATKETSLNIIQQTVDKHHMIIAGFAPADLNNLITQAFEK